MSVNVNGISLGIIDIDEALITLRDVAQDPDARILRSHAYDDGSFSWVIGFTDNAISDLIGQDPDERDRELSIQCMRVDSEAAGPLTGHEGEIASFLKLGAFGRANEIIGDILRACDGGCVEDERTNETVEVAGAGPTLD